MLDVLISMRARLDVLLVVIVSAVAWGVLAVGSNPLMHSSHCSYMHQMCHSESPASSNFDATLVYGSVLMVVAMMTPLLIGTLGHIRTRSFAHRRYRAALLFVAAYCFVWTAATWALLCVLSSVAPQSPIRLSLIVAVIGAALTWQCSPLKQRCLNRCHARPALAAFGVSADLGIARWGFTHSVWCIGSCWSLMLLPMLVSGLHLYAMAAATLWMFGERLERPRVPQWRLIAPRRLIRILVAQVQEPVQSASFFTSQAL
jgi:predicted metal-binding membrane protein